MNQSKVAGMIVGGTAVLAAVIVIGALSSRRTAAPAAPPPTASAPVQAAPIVLDARCAPVIAGLTDISAVRADEWFSFRRGTTEGVRVLPAQVTRVFPPTSDGAVELVVTFEVVFPSRHFESAALVAPASGVDPRVASGSRVAVIALGPVLMSGSSIAVCGVVPQ